MHRIKPILITILAFMLNSCDDGLFVMTNAQRMSIDALEAVAAEPGDTVQVRGRNLSSELDVFVNGSRANFSVDEDARSGDFIMPNEIGSGLLNVEFILNQKVIASFSMINAYSIEAIPVLSISADYVCNTFIFKKPTGELERGRGTCSEALADCSRDGQVDCLASDEFPALSVTEIAEKTFSGGSSARIELCVIGKDSSGNWQTEASAVTASSTKDTTRPQATISGEPTATISNAPSSVTAMTTLDVTIAGTNVSHYKYKLRTPTDPMCSLAAGYSAELAVTAKITDDSSTLADGAVELCVIGKDSSGNWQSEGTATAVSWTKDTNAPLATINGAPSGTNNTTALNVTVAAAGVSHYKYKIREAADSSCSSALGYSAEIPAATPIHSSLSSLADGVIQLCLIGRDSAGNWQAETEAATSSWTKDTTRPLAMISGEPTGTNNAMSLDVVVAGADVVEYKYKLREATDLPCSDSTGYSAAIPVAIHITNSVSGLTDGVLQICVIGKDSSGNWQLEGTPTVASWTKSTLPPTAGLSGQPTGSSNATSLNIRVAGTDVTHYKYKIRAMGDAICSNATGYSGEIAIATLITNDISAMLDGAVEICVVGRGVNNLYQAYADATTATWQKDALLPGSPTAFSISPREAALRANWTSGAGDVQGFIVLRRAGATFSDIPVTGATYNAGDSIGSSTVAYVGTSLSLTDNSLINGTRYYYRLFAYDTARNYSGGLIASALPVSYEPPAADSLLLWTDSSYTESLFLDSGFVTPVTANGDKVAGIKDLSSTQVPLIQPTVLNRPTYKTGNIFGHPGLEHSDNHWLSAASSNLPAGNQQHSLVFIGSFEDTATSGAIHIGSSADDSKIGLYGDSSLIIYSFGNNDLRFDPPSTSSHVFIGTYNGVDGTAVNRKLYIDGTEKTAASSSGVLTNTLNLPTNPAVTIGSHDSGTQGLTGDLAEVLLYDHVLSSAEIIDLGKYAWNKWGVPQISVSAESTPSSIALTWVDGIASSSYLVVRRPGSPPIFTPSNGISYGSGAQGSDTIVFASTGTGYTDNSVLAGTTYYYAVYGNDGSNNYTPAASANAKMLVTPALSITPDNTKLNFSWSTVSEADSYLLVRRAAGAPTFVPTNGVSYSTGSQGSDSVVYIGNATSFQDTGLMNGTTYHYKLYASNRSLSYAAATTNNATPVAPCTPSSTTYTVDTNITMPADCTTLLVKAWGGGGGGGGKKSGAPGNGGGGGYSTRTLSHVNAGASISIKVGTGGRCDGQAGTGYANGGQGGRFLQGSAGGGTAVGGTGGTSEVNGGAGKYGGGGGGGNEDDRIGGGGGGASSVTVEGTISVIAGGGGGGGASDWRFMVPHDAGHGGAGCGLAGGNGEVNAGSGGGGGACLGASTSNGSGASPGNSAEAGSAATGGTGATSSCGTANHGSNGKVILSFSP